MLFTVVQRSGVDLNMILPCVVIFTVTGVLAEQQYDVPAKKAFFDFPFEYSGLSTSEDRRHIPLQNWKQHQREVDNDKPAFGMEEIVAISMGENAQKTGFEPKERFRRAPKTPEMPSSPEGMAKPPEGMPKPEGMPSSPDSMPKPPEGMSPPSGEMPKPPEGMSSPPEGMPKQPEGMPKPPEGMPSPPEGMSSAPEGMPKPPEGMPSPPGMG